MDSVRVRQMLESDLPSAERASAATFLEGERSTRRVSAPEPEPRTAAESVGWLDRTGHFLATDPAGCWVAVDDGGQVVGFAVSQNRDRLWFLVTYGVLPGFQRKGIGKRLMAAVLAHAGDRQGMFISTVHPGATRSYWRAGFELQPLMGLIGTVDRSTLPAVTGLRAGSADDIEWMDRLDGELRGAGRGTGRGSDHLHLQETARLIVSEEKDRQGYVYTDDGSGRALLLAARHPETAQKLLWETLASSRPPASSPAAGPDRPTAVTAVTAVTFTITAANRWALDVGLAAGLDLHQEGYLALRGMDTPAPYLPSGRYL